MTFWLDCPPPTTTAQMKRVRVVNGKPRFFHGAKMQRQARDWSLLLSSHRPPAPRTGPLALEIELHYAHTRESLKIGEFVPKVSRPDVDGAVKHLIVTMQRVGFFADDAKIASLTCVKYHAPETGIMISLKEFKA
jgi:Holliday junction resolvase RusA-like endonuclease